MQRVGGRQVEADHSEVQEVPTYEERREDRSEEGGETSEAGRIHLMRKFTAG